MPIPHARKKKGFYPFREMEVGDSFFVPVDGRKRKGVQSAILGSARNERLPDMIFTTRFIEDADGYRCWRVA